jgi:hypothetical protein
MLIKHTLAMIVTAHQDSCSGVELLLAVQKDRRPRCRSYVLHMMLKVVKITDVVLQSYSWVQISNHHGMQDWR